MKNRILSVLLTGLMLLPVALPGMAKVSGPIAKTTSVTTTKTKMTKSGKIDINTASRSELMSVKGIGAKTADKIIANRPYSGKDDLVSKKLVDKGQYAMIKDSIIAKQGGKMVKKTTTTTKTVKK